jgi:hypothetical protein
MVQISLFNQSLPLPCGWVKIDENFPFACDFFYLLACKEDEIEALKAGATIDLDDEALKTIVSSLGSDYDQSEDGLYNYEFVYLERDLRYYLELA